MNRGPFDANEPIGPGDQGPTNGGIPDHLIDSILDGDLPREKVRRALERLRRDRESADELDWTADALDALRSDSAAPDFSEIILARTGMHRSWLSGVMQRRMLIGRVAGVAAVLGIIAGAFMLQRVSPETFRAEPTPVTGLATAVPSDAAHAASVMRLPVAFEMASSVRAADLDEVYLVGDDPEANWRDGLEAMASLRDLWPSRAPAPQPMPGLHPIGYSPETITLIAPIVPTQDRESSAAIVGDRR